MESNRSNRSIRGVIALAALTFVAACGGSSSGSSSEPPPPEPEPWSFGANFRDTVEHAVDPAGYVPVLGDKSMYPQAEGGVTFGWVGIEEDAGRDRNGSTDPRLQGVNKTFNDGGPASFFIELPSAGDYNVCLALGDLEFDHPAQYAEVRDGDTTLAVIAGSTVAGRFLDARGGSWSTTGWPTGNACQTLLFSSGQFELQLGTPTPTADPTDPRVYSDSVIATLSLERR